MQARARSHALMEGVTAGILFGTAAIFVRYAHGIDSFSIVFWRLAIALMALGMITILFCKTIQLDLVRKNAKRLMILSVFLGLHLVFFTASLNDTTILNSTVLVNTLPFFSLFISSFVFNLKPSRLALVGLAISFTGICLIAIGETMASKPFAGVSSSLKGDVEAVIAALFLAIYLNYGKEVRNRMNILSLMVPIYAAALVVVGIVGLALGSSFLSVSLVPSSILPLIGLGLLPTAIAHTLYFSSLSSLKSFETATMALLEPVGATILGIVAFLEIPAPIFALGAVFVLTGILFTIRKGG